jgi:hypothetical protein
MYNPSAVMENLQQASFVNKTRLVLTVSIFFMTMLLQPILIAAKVNVVTDTDTDTDSDSILSDTDWIVLLIPLWILYGTWVALMGILALVVPDAVREFTVTFLQHVTVLVGLILTAQQWDRPVAEKNNWQLTAIPFYVAIMWRMYGTQCSISSLRQDQARMVSPEHLVAQEGVNGLEDLTEGQREEIANKYLVVTVDSDTVVAAMQSFAMDCYCTVCRFVPSWPASWRETLRMRAGTLSLFPYLSSWVWKSRLPFCIVAVPVCWVVVVTVTRMIWCW